VTKNPLSKVAEHMRIESDGQVTIPAELRERCGLLPGTEVEMIATVEGLLIRKRFERRTDGRALVEHMRGRATRSITTDEIMELMRGE